MSASDRTISGSPTIPLEDHQHLKSRIDKAHADTNRALDGAKQEAGAAAGHARDSWERTRADAKARVDQIKTNAHRRAEQFDAKMAARDADDAEAERDSRSSTRSTLERRRSTKRPRSPRIRESPNRQPAVWQFPAGPIHALSTRVQPGR